jgi:hypothetical protein
MQQQHDPARLRMAEVAICECQRLGLRLFARLGMASVGRMVNGELLEPPPEWDRVVAALGPEIAHILGWRASFLGAVERLPDGCKVYWPDWRREPAPEALIDTRARA